ncbi:hypothetical protein FOCC_FOCC013939 [Frankliniella occidentalis]|nr:hypothetical protein FOCC_FOCC013939 [Frankliniella occidentalis]
MALNPAYEEIGKGFVQQYYALFDDPAQRPNLVNMYNVLLKPFMSFLSFLPTMPRARVTCGEPETSFMTFEGIQLQGSKNIMEKLTSLAFQKINRLITEVDSQPMFDGGVLINVLGRLQTDEDPAHGYIQTFVLKPIGTSFYVQHDCDDDPPHAYSQIFVLKPLGGSFYCAHDIFRLNIHNSA